MLQEKPWTDKWNCKRQDVSLLHSDLSKKPVMASFKTLKKIKKMKMKNPKNENFSF